ncbi:MAG: asparagine synthase (glutamine-hydrolyzing) [Phycisphaerales bacterium]|nr:asparagine synthase (glutamine-hydrolyzing) [Phycisphaerales bacterium]
MCGITGFYSFNTSSASIIANVQQSNEKLTLRGPDKGDIFINETVALGHRRLSIIDTSAAATQPMKSPDKRYVIVFNGEIFNYKELSDRYLSEYWAENGQPQTHSDTEVLLHLLIRYGIDCLVWLHGFFAFSFYDTLTGQMIIARDPLGKKPLLYYHQPNSFAFSSEMKALLEWNVPRKINFSVLHQYLQLNYVPQAQSMIEGVSKLKPGHFMILSKKGLKQYQAFYTPQCFPEQYRQYTYQEAKEKLVQKMDESVQERMISDVPLGAFLSGGIDSSVIVALASRHTDKLNTFSVGYKDNKFFDETQYAQLVAKKYNTNHHVFSLSNNDFLEHLFGVLDYIDEPFADSSALPVYILSKNTRKHVTVALSGDGADEVFSGYNKHAAEWKMRQSSLAKTLVKLGAPLWHLLPHSRNNKITNLFRQLNRFAEGAKLGTQERYWRWASFNTPHEASALLHPNSLAKVDFQLLRGEKEAILAAIQSDDFNEVLLTDVNLVLLSDMLVKVDMMSMANSIEVRSPFLDKRVVDYAFALPSNYKIDGSMKKKIVQDAFRDMLPPELYNRPKHGFEIPLLDWFRNELWGLINNDLLEKSFVAQQGIFDVQHIETLKLKLRSNNPEDSHATIWALIVFQYWWKKYIA